jgi:hypothetical protein
MALQDIGTDLSAVRSPVNPLEGMGARFPELQSAVRAADTCVEVSRARATRPTPPPSTR